MKRFITWTSMVLAIAGAALASSPNGDLYVAIRTNNLELLKVILRDGNVANAKDEHGVTPLMYAAAAGSPEAMSLLLDAHADPNAVNGFGSTALMWSATDIAKVRLLLTHGADVKTVSRQGRTALQLAA